MAKTERKMRPSKKRELQSRYGTRCYICGEEDVEYHHLIPLWMGGEDTINNFIPLCKWHHMLLHGARTMKWHYKKGGRKKKPTPEGYEYIIEDYLHCRIGTSEMKSVFGFSGGTKLTDQRWFKEYKKHKGIKAYRNNVDVIKSNIKRGKHRNKATVGWMEYENGDRQEFLWEDVREFSQ